MSSDEERLEEMLKAVMEVENTTQQSAQSTAEEEEIPAPELPEIGEDLLDIPLDDIPDIPLDEIPDIPLDDIEDISLEDIPDIPFDDISDVPEEEVPVFSTEDDSSEADEKVSDPAAENLAETAEEEKAEQSVEQPVEQPQELQEKEMAVDPMAFLSMSEEEIDKVLEEEAASAEGSSEKQDDGELSDLLGGSDDLEDIQKLLQMSDAHEQVDDSGTIKDTVFDSVEAETRNSSDGISDDGEEGSEELQKNQAKGTDKRKEKKKKEKKTKVKEEKKKENKEGLGKKLAALFFGSDEDELEEKNAENEKQKDGGADAKGGAGVKEKKKKEKKKKEPKKKEPDPKKAAKEKQQKEKNAEKAKKKAEKAEKAEKEKRAAKKLPKKKVIVWVIFCASIGAGILLMNSVGMSTLQLTEARNAFDEKDYETAYRLLNGRELSEEDQLLFRQSSAMLHLVHAEEAYGNHLKLNKPVVALEDLLRGVGKYQELQQAGESELITPEVTAQYQRILDILQENYSLTENGALEINALESDYEYSLQLEALVNGEIYQSQADMESEQEEEAAAYPELEDILPEEEEYLNGSSD